MTRARLLQISEAADILGVPAASLRAVADRHGKTIRMGRAVRLHPDDLEDLIQLCRCQPKGPALPCEDEEADRPSMSSATRASPKCQQAQATADRLKSLLRSTSRKKAGAVVPLNRVK